VEQLAGIFRYRPAAERLNQLVAEGVPCAMVRDLEEVFASPEGRRWLRR
jgi:hypothetical protein